MNGARKRISCQRCRLRKVRCNRLQPCDTCTASGANCIFRDDDTKRRPVSRDYVTALEERLSSYEQLIVRLKEASEDERKSLLNEHGFAEIQPRVESDDGIFDYTGSSRRSTMNMLSGPQGSSSFYGPTSVYPKEIMTPESGQSFPNVPSRSLERWHDERLHESLNVDNGNLIAALSAFFKYQHSQCMFIHRGAFLQDYNTLEYGSKYCSYPLLYATCSLGARISGNSHLQQHAEFFSHISYEMISKRSLETPHVTVIQTLLCLAFSEFSKGCNTKGWMLSGMAFRMGQDLGLHQDPRFVTNDDTSIQNVRHHEIRRHVYWGCYVADKFISLYLGRPMFLHEDDAAVNPIEPSLEHVGGNVPDGIIELDKSTEDHGIILSVMTHLVELSKIIESVLSQVFSTKMIKKPRKDLVMTRLARLEELNLRLFRWHSALPETIAWNRWIQRTDGLHRHVLTLHVLHHSTLISLNRHFIRPTPGFARKSQSKEICMTSVDNIIAILRHYRAQCSLSNAPIILIYSAIMAGTALSFTQENRTNINANSPEDREDRQQTQLDSRVNTIIKMLEECSQVYPLAREASLKLKACFGVASQQQNGSQQYLSFPDAQGSQTAASEIQNFPTSSQLPQDILDDQHWLQDPMMLHNSMDAGILDFTSVNLPDMGSDNLLGFLDAGPQDGSFYEPEESPLNSRTVSHPPGSYQQS